MHYVRTQTDVIHEYGAENKEKTRLEKITLEA
jgi:hypothetical protein